MTFEFLSLTVILLLISLAIFGYLAIRSRSVRDFQFQISMIILVWITSEILGILIENSADGIIPKELDLWIHLIAMISISVTFWLRFYYSKRAGRRFIE